MITTDKVPKPFILRQADYLADLAEEAERHFNGPEQAEWYQKLEREYDNIVGVVEWLKQRAFSQGQNQRSTELKILLRIAGALWRFWQVRGYLAQGRVFLEEIIAECKQAGISQYPALQAKILHGAGVLTSVQGDFDQPVTYFEESLKLRRKLRDRAGITACLNNLGILALYRTDFGQATTFLEESLTLRRQQGDKWGMCNTLNNLANLKLMQGDYPAARSFLEESLHYGRELGDKRSIAICLYNLGNIALQYKNNEQALDYFRESLAIRQELADKVGLAECMEGLAGFKEIRGQSDKAACLYGAAANLRETLGAPLEPVDRPNYYQFREQTKLKLGQVAFERYWVSGKGLPQEQAFQYALAD